MTDITQELARRAIGPISEPRVAVDRSFLLAVLARLNEQAEQLKARRLCDCCEMHEPFTPADKPDEHKMAPFFFARFARMDMR